jgi:hypothetical protein
LRTRPKTKAKINKAESRKQFLLSTFPISALPEEIIAIHWDGRRVGRGGV